VLIGTTWWTGPGSIYGPEYPRALRSQLSDLGQDLIVLGNGDGSDRPLKTGFTRWWSKLEWLAPWNADIRPALVVDLDTFVVGGIGPVLSLDDTKLWLIRQFWGTKRLGESGLFIVPKDTGAMWEAALRYSQDKYGDGAFLRKFPHEFIVDEVDGILSYKAHHLQDGYPDGTRIVCFHGKPKPANACGWAQEFFWRHAC
jgi:hypothetical protein